MITYKQCSLFDSNAQVLVNPVNCVGAMGKGLALEFKKLYPRMFEEYKIDCSKVNYKLGTVGYHSLGDNKFIFNAATKFHWRNDSTDEGIKNCCENITKLIELFNVQSIAIPALGCGLGGLDFERVNTIMKYHFEYLDCDIFIYPPKS